MTLNDQIKWEVENNVANLNGKNNKKILGKERINDWQYTYNSTSRNVIRMWWLTKFTTQLFLLLATEPDRKLSSIMSSSYSVGFSAHHAYAIQAIAQVAMKCVGKKDWLYGALGIRPDELDRFALLSKNFAAVRDNIH